MAEPKKDSPPAGDEEHMSSYVMLEAAEGREGSNEPVLVGLDTPTQLANEGDPRSAWVLINDAASSVSSQGSNGAEALIHPPTEATSPEPSSKKDGTQQESPTAAAQIAARAEEQRQREEQEKAAAEEAARVRARAEEAAAAERAERFQRRAELERRALEEQRIHQEKLAAEKAARAQAQQNEERRRREEEARVFSLRCQRERNNFLTSEDELRRSLTAAEAANLQALAARREDARRRALEEMARRVEAEEQEYQRRAFELSNDTIQRMAREIADSEDERERQEVEAAARAAELESKQRLVERDAAYAATLLPRSSPTARLQAPEPLLPEPEIPARRRCDCLGASSGIHRRDCLLHGA